MRLSRYLPRLAIIGLAAATLKADADPAETFPAYVPSAPLTGTIRSWGHGYLKGMMKIWEADFRKYQPGIEFKDELVSSAAAMAGLYSGRADIGVLAREITPPEIAAYEKVTKQPITPVDVLTGSVGNQDKIMALGIFVNKDNPIEHLSFAQLDAIFGAELRQGAPSTIREWGQLGLGSDWASKPIQPYSGLAFEAPGYFFSQTVLKGSVLWNPALKQFDNVEDSVKRYVDAYQKALDTLAGDRYGIALAGAGYHNANVKRIALSIANEGPFVEATKENIISRAYPLARPVRFYIHNGPAIPTDPKVVEGQDQVAAEGDFLPLTAEVARAELNKLPKGSAESPR
jgi:phosphate transport system substrate-binding protein